MTPLGFLVLILFVIIFVDEAMKNSGHSYSGDISQANENDVLKKRVNFSADDRYGASTYDDPGEYYAENAGRFEDYSEACYYYHMAHMGRDDAEDF